MEIYISVDIETDGRTPGINNMLSLGMVALHPDTLNEHASFYRTLKRVDGLRPDNTTMNWWDEFPNAWAATRTNPQPADIVMIEAEGWAKSVVGQFNGAKAVFVAAPVGFDFSFYLYYAHRFVGDTVFGHRALDMRSWAAGAVNQPYLSPNHGVTIDDWKTSLPHTHVAIDDAREQAAIFGNMLKWRKQRGLVEITT